ncbi:porin family protein [Chitinophaga solisilvae]|uniref:porin family protein n=1 Tax=Chitinophaga solisilvae TaxID=1233460 RepID=UPI0013708679|nr:porin family protein [Chitinophaga solisilvae]
MKRNAIALFVLLLTTAVSAIAQVRLGVKAGYSNTHMKTDHTDYTQRKAGWHAGLMADISIAGNFFLQPQLLYSAKGYRIKEITVHGINGDFVIPGATVKLSYLELPVNFLYKHQLGSGHLFVGAGPYAAFAIGGKDGDNKIKFGKGGARRFEAGAGFLAGYELKNGLLFSATYSLGLTDVYDYGTSKNNYIGVSVGFLLPRK